MCSPAKNFEFLNFVAKSSCGTKIVPQSWESPTGTLHGHVGIQNARANIPHSGILVKEIRQSIQTAGNTITSGFTNAI